ncbi:hypothetical protein [Variovorax sp. dw_954]|uniref:hypothetical protein n=1 Tax=Variovorax sp. dw_954 TaxID=2720078 RepID=UPI001BD3B9B8|nr:hypothetical protein [Variovorax sp. dw_954]
MSRDNHIWFALAVLAGKVDLTYPTIPAHLGLTRAAQRHDDIRLADQVHAGSLYLHALLLGHPDPMRPYVLGRLMVLRALYLTRGDEDMVDLLRRALDGRAAALQRADEDDDRAYLESLIDGTGDLLSEDTFPRMEPLFAKYPEGSEMFALLERAATLFGDAVQEVAYWAVAGIAIDQARYGAAGDEWDPD